MIVDEWEMGRERERGRNSTHSIWSHSRIANKYKSSLVCHPQFTTTCLLTISHNLAATTKYQRILCEWIIIYVHILTNTLRARLSCACGGPKWCTLNIYKYNINTHNGDVANKYYIIDCESKRMGQPQHEPPPTDSTGDAFAWVWACFMASPLNFSV